MVGDNGTMTSCECFQKVFGNIQVVLQDNSSLRLFLKGHIQALTNYLKSLTEVRGLGEQVIALLVSVA